ncbi:MAG TPA: NTP transferase domain-containing protein [Pseudonocardiaceae bacterium]|nr:NTP transferase domain-containing protein [Pseudonocardiaceae bacterium]
MHAFTAVVVAGGAGRRLGGVDKPALVIGSTTLLDRAIAALAAAEPVVVVGPHRPTGREVRWAREDPPGAGPVAALAAGLTALAATAPDTEVAVLAADLLAVGPGTIDRLRAALAGDPNADGALLVDAGGHRQWLTGVWRLDALRAALPADPVGAALRAVLGGLSVVEVTELAGETADVDTPEDLARARRGATDGG